MSDSITFSFGENWERFLSELHPQAIEATVEYFDDWLPNSIQGVRFADVGSGSGLSSLVAYQRGAVVQSFDVDPHSVEATRRLWQRAGSPPSWTVGHGSILDEAFVRGLGTFDVVFAWGVLHHTGALWKALANAAGLVGPGGVMWIALYHKTRTSPRSLRLKADVQPRASTSQALVQGAIRDTEAHEDGASSRLLANYRLPQGQRDELVEGHRGLARWPAL